MVYAVPGAASTSSPVAASTTGDKIYFKLVQVAAVANGLPGANASGYAGVSISGQSLSVEWSITGAVSGALLELDMQAAATNSTGTRESFAIATAQVNSAGEAGGTGSATLDPGNYSIGLTVVNPSTDAHSAVFTSDPATAQVTISSSQDGQTQPNMAIGNTMSYSLLPLPVYLGSQAPSNFSFREGGALIVVTGDQLQVTTSFLGAANTEFLTIVQTTHQNITAGTVTTTSTGGGVFKGSVTLGPGTYDVGLLVYVSGNTASPVAVSDPRAIEVTLPVGTQTSSTSTSSESQGVTSTSTTVSTNQTKTTSIPPPETVNLLTLVPVTTSSAPQGYLYGKGTGGFGVTGGSIYFSLLFVGQNPNTQYSLVLSVNGTARTIGNYTTNGEGGATTHASATLGAGQFALGLSVVDLVNFNAPTTVLTSVPASFTVFVHATSTSTSTTMSTTRSSSTETETQREGHWTFKLIPVTINNVPPDYHFATSGTAIVLLDAHHSLLSVVLGFQNGNPSTTYSAALVLNGTSVNLGSMTTNREGAAELHSSIQVNPGTYLIGVEVYDVSDVSEFNASGPVLVMTSDPNTQVAVIVPTSAESSSTSAENSSGSQGSTTQSVGTTTATSTVTTINAGSEVEAQIHEAVANLTIPVTVQITPLASSTTVLDSRFSLSVGQQVGNGLVIAISGENVTGPRVLLINMSRTAPLALYPSLNITLDGVPVVEATSTLQVLNPLPSDPARYVLVATSDSIQLLVSIPHFSLHLVQIAGQVVQNIGSSLALDAPLLVGSIIVITIVFAGAYGARKRYFSILP